MELYENLFRKRLKVSEKFLEENSQVIREKLRHAADEFKRDHGNVFAINMCLHAASSVILSNPSHLKETLRAVKETRGLEDKDPSTVLTVCALYYLVQWDADRVAEKQKTKLKTDADSAADYEAKLEVLRSGFDGINWLVGDEAMRVLGLKKMASKFTKLRPGDASPSDPRKAS